MTPRKPPRRLAAALTAAAVATAVLGAVAIANARGAAAVSATSASTPSLKSDEFNGTSLDQTVWSFDDPVGDSQLSFNGSEAVISVPAGTEHNLWVGANQAPRLLQAAPNSDFVVQAKFDTPLTSRYQMEGFVVQQDDTNFLRFEVHYDGSSTNVFVASIHGSSATTQIYSPINAPNPLYLQLARSGTTFTFQYSGDGSKWTTAGSFSDPLTVTALGPYIGNAGESPPAFAGAIDYFRNVTPAPDTAPPQISAVSGNGLGSLATVAWTTDERSTSSVKWGLDTTYGRTEGNQTLVTSHSLTLVGLACATTYHYQVTSVDAAGNSATSADQSFSTGACPQSLTSDEFNGSSLNQSVWSFDDPVGDSQLSFNGSEATIAVTAGSSHDLWAGANQAPRLLQSAPNIDFVVQAKYDTPLVAQYQTEGIVVQQDDTNFLRFELHSDYLGTHLFVASIHGATATTQADVLVSPSVGYLKVKRKGSTWTAYYSSDGSTWTTGATFSDALTVTAMGPYIGNAGSPAPAFTGTIDYFRDVTPPPDVTPPVQSNINAAPNATLATVTWTTDEPASAQVDYGTTTNYGQSVAVPTLVTSHSATLVGLACNTTYHYRVDSTDESHNLAQSADHTFSTGACPQNLTSDEFNGSSLDQSVWSFDDPVGDSQLSFNGSEATIAVPAGSSHDLWAGSNEAPRLLQPAPNTNFVVQAKYDTALVSQYQTEGIVVEQDDANFLRFEFHSDWAGTHVFVASIHGSTPTTQAYLAVPLPPVVYLKVKRSTSTWTAFYSSDGQTWTKAVSFSDPLTVTAIGPYIGNSGSPAPAFTGTIDYFRDVTPPPDVTPPVQSSIAAAPTSKLATVTWTTDEPASAEVDYGTTTAYGQSVTVPTLVTSHSATLVGLACSTTYHYRVDSTDESNNVAHSADATFTTGACPRTLASDEFNGSSLDQSVWSFDDPVGDTQLSFNGSEAAIAIPAGTSHDLWAGANQAPRLLQAAPNTDFTLQAKYDTPLNSRYQMEGFVVEQDDSNLLRFEVHYDGSSTNVFAASIHGTTATTQIYKAISAPLPLYLQLTRSGTMFTLQYSSDGSTWTTAGSFSDSLVVNALGPYVGNSGSSPPAFNGTIDYFHASTPPPDVTPPVMQNLQVKPRATSLVVQWSTDEPATSAVAAGTSTAYELGTTSDPTLLTAHQVVIGGLTCGTTYHVSVQSTDASGNAATAPDQTASTVSCAAAGAPTFDIWYGTTQSFGTIGTPQQWVNVLGTVSDPAGVSSLSYTLNGSAPQPLSIGPNGERLVGQGDFNVEMGASWLNPGPNDVAITATNANGVSNTVHVNVVWNGPKTWPLPYTAHWTSTAAINSAAQIVDGQWFYDGSGVRTAVTGYDRAIALGQMTWTNYEVTVPITFHSFNPAGSAVGVALGWQGHDGWNQPLYGHPFGLFCSYAHSGPTAPYQLQMEQNPGPSVEQLLASKPETLATGVAYTLKVRELQLADGSTQYSCKLWPSGSTEPSGWDLTANVQPWSGETGTHPGSVLLDAHEADATFGDVTVNPISG